MVYCFKLKLENQDCWFLVLSQSALCCVTMHRFLNFLCSKFFYVCYFPYPTLSLTLCESSFLEFSLIAYSRIETNLVIEGRDRKDNFYSGELFCREKTRDYTGKKT